MEQKRSKLDMINVHFDRSHKNNFLSYILPTDSNRIFVSLDEEGVVEYGPKV